MRLTRLELSGFKSFGKKTVLSFDTPVTAIVGPNGSGKSNIAEGFRWVLGEQSLKSLRGKRGEDLIFSGVGSSGKLGKATVSVVFDNSSKRFNLDYDEVIVTRTVYRDGVNEYAINGSVVRLKDVIELLGSVSLGSTGHHIISQGEADRILNSSIRERQEIIEEALGLKIYQWKIEESEKKIAKTEENIRRVESLRREIAPHLRFLKKQVEKIEKADEMRRELKNLYFEYFKREDLYISETRQNIASRLNAPVAELADVATRLLVAEQAIKKEVEQSSVATEIASLDRILRETRLKKEEIGRSLGRLDGMIEMKLEQVKEVDEDDHLISFQSVSQASREIIDYIETKIKIDNVSILQSALLEVKRLTTGLISRFETKSSPKNNLDLNLDSLQVDKNKLEDQIKKLIEEEEQILVKQDSFKKQLEEERELTRGAEREIFELRARKISLQSTIEAVEAEKKNLFLVEENFTRELDEAVVLVDREVLDYERFMASFVPDGEERSKQEERRRLIERIKIRLEDLGVEGGDVLEEYKEVTSRDEYLTKELADLLQASASLKVVIKELKVKLASEFAEGLEKINNQFNNFFSLMFGGGSASLQLIEEVKRRRGGSFEDEEGIGNMLPDEVEKETGIDINVNLPRKQIKGLQMLSGGERALTSIALLFAMSQVNPPPFLILDETDAALDEANSRKYGEMVTALAQHSQLIVITHNRETMSRAGILYGVTMGSDGVSKLLSIRFDEASGWAK